MNIRYENEYQYMPFIVKELEDIPGGGSIAIADLDKGVADSIPPGVFVGVDENGLRHVLLAAILVEAATDAAKAYKVKKGTQFKVGQFISCGDVDGVKASAITAINRTDAGFDEIKVSATLGVALEAGMHLHQVKAADTEGGKSELLFTPESITKREIDIRGSHASVGLLVRGTVNVANMGYGAPKVFRKALEPLIRFE